MHAIIFLIIIGVLIASGFLIAFIWAVRSGQYDDDYGPAVRILFDDEPLDQAGTDKKRNNNVKKDLLEEPEENSYKNNHK